MDGKKREEARPWWKERERERAIKIETGEREEERGEERERKSARVTTDEAVGTVFRGPSSCVL